MRHLSRRTKATDGPRRDGAISPATRSPSGPERDRRGADSRKVAEEQVTNTGRFTEGTRRRHSPRIPRRRCADSLPRRSLRGYDTLRGALPARNTDGQVRIPRSQRAVVRIAENTAKTHQRLPESRLVPRSAGTGRAEAERTLNTLWDSGPCAGRAGGGSSGPRASVRKEEGARSRVGACNADVTNTRANSPSPTSLPPRVCLVLSLPSHSVSVFLPLLSRSLFPIYLYSFLIRVVCRGPTPLAVSLRQRSACACLRWASGPTEDAPLRSALLLCAVFARSYLYKELLWRDHVIRKDARRSSFYAASHSPHSSGLSAAM